MITGFVKKLLFSPAKSAGMTERIENSNINAGTAPDSDDPNSHLFDYIKYYSKLDKPGFAVLITGEWGSGKTHLIKKILPWEGEEKKSYYVSLFGLKNAGEVDAALYVKMFPKIEKIQKYLNNVGDATKGLSYMSLKFGDIFNHGANLLSAYIRQEIHNDLPIIFDDLERSSMSPKEVLGLINTYVEHKKCRIVVVAHDEKLVEKFKEAKEKIFGHTIRVEPNTKSAFDNFVKEIDIEIYSQILDFKNEIIDTFNQSGAKSLRILRHVIFDIARFFKTLEKSHFEKRNAMRDIVSLVAAFVIASRNNWLDTNEIIKNYTAGSNFPLRNSTSFIEIKKRFKNIDMTNTAISDNVLINILLYGRYNKQEICASLDNSTYFTGPENLPAWLRIAQFYNLSDEITEEAQNEMELQFKERRAVKIGEMLHIFALRMMMAKHNILDCSVANIAEESKKYIDDLLNKKQLPTPDEEDASSDFLSTAAYGYLYYVEDSYRELFKDVWQHLIKQQSVALEQKYPEIRDELLDMLIKDPEKFAGTICFLPSHDHKYARLPVMRAIDANEFVETWLSASNRSEVWDWTRKALVQRYEGNALHPDNGALTSETGWIKAVLEQMRKRADTETGFRKLRIERSIPKIGFPD